MKVTNIFHRPLVPALISCTGGIVLGHEAFPASNALVFPLAVSVVCFLFVSFFVPPKFRLFFILLAFFEVGILWVTGDHDESRIMPLAAQRKKVKIEGTVVEPMQVLDQIGRLRVRAHNVYFDGSTLKINEDILVSLYDHFTYFSPGQKIRFPARLRPFKNFNNPGRYDYEFAMRLKDIACAASVSDGRYVVPLGPSLMPFPHGILEQFRRPIRHFLEQELPFRDAALFRALVLGERQNIHRELREPFNRTGLGHVLAVSGLHIGLLAWLSFSLIRYALSFSYVMALRMDPRKVAALLTCLPVIGYTCLAGFQVSGQRAMIMVLAYLFSLMLGREKEVWSTLALAAFVILAMDPLAIYSISFQLSFAAVIGILWLTPMFLRSTLHSFKRTDTEHQLFRRLLIYLLELSGVTISAMVFLLPITALYFHRISPVGILANLTVVPILGLLVLPAGLLSCIILPFSHVLAVPVLHIGDFGLQAMMGLISFWSRLPFSDLRIVTPNLPEILLYYGFIIALLSIRHGAWAKAVLLLMALLISADTGYWVYRTHFNNDLKVTYLDVGQANAALVEFPSGKKMIIDGGGFSRDHFDTGEMVIAPFLWHSKICKIDYLVLSHPQSDHMNGLRFIAKSFHPKEFWYNGRQTERPAFKELMTILDEKRVKKLLPADLAAVREIGGARVEVLHPLADTSPAVSSLGGTGLNNNSLVLRISFKGISFLFPGDIEEPAERVLTSSFNHTLKTDILLSPHHGSRTSNSEGFLQLVDPKVCIISCGEANFAGLPHGEALERLEALGCGVLRTDLNGAVQCRVKSEGLEMRTFLPNERF